MIAVVLMPFGSDDAARRQALADLQQIANDDVHGVRRPALRLLSMAAESVALIASFIATMVVPRMMVVIPIATSSSISVNPRAGSDPNARRACVWLSSSAAS